jgi:hypothetical protein
MPQFHHVTQRSVMAVTPLWVLAAGRSADILTALGVAGALQWRRAVVVGRGA